MNDFLTAIGLVFIIEGLILFASPKRLLKILNIITKYSEKKIRLTGSFSMIIGVILIMIIRN
ncbi:DUF2065 domain-containing protein [Alphaproteobacteria bacterium]|jgi:uncharacterized protein YjeT (DUF2065 family)|nr:DUF2065 domain-containing protein [Alphaproteobacteria bacterium]